MFLFSFHKIHSSSSIDRHRRVWTSNVRAIYPYRWHIMWVGLFRWEDLICYLMWQRNANLNHICIMKSPVVGCWCCFVVTGSRGLRIHSNVCMYAHIYIYVVFFRSLFFAHIDMRTHFATQGSFPIFLWWLYVCYFLLLFILRYVSNSCRFSSITNKKFCHFFLLSRSVPPATDNFILVRIA